MKRDYSILLFLENNNLDNENKKTVVLGCIHKTRTSCIQAVEVREGHSVLAIGQNAGEVAE
jgi:hypothetical protein